MSEVEFYGAVVFKYRKIAGKADFSIQVQKIVTRNKEGYSIDILRQTACMVVNPILLDSFAFLFNCKPVG